MKLNVITYRLHHGLLLTTHQLRCTSLFAVERIPLLSRCLSAPSGLDFIKLVFTITYPYQTGSLWLLMPRNLETGQKPTPEISERRFLGRPRSDDVSDPTHF